MIPLSVPGLSGFVLRHNHSAIVFAEDKMRTRLTKLNKSQTFQRRGLLPRR
jgi:hypothetical protein